jgi:hypothetical protein
MDVEELIAQIVSILGFQQNSEQAVDVRNRVEAVISEGKAPTLESIVAEYQRYSI